MILDDNKISCCTLIADCIKYNASGNLIKSSYVYHVPVKDTAEYMNFISETLAYFGQQCTRVYISGFIITTQSFVWNKERIFAQIKMFAEQKNVQKKEKIIIKTR